jgi:hypothetical protein
LYRRIGNETERRVRAEYEERGRREEVTIRQGNIIIHFKFQNAVLIIKSIQ